MKRTIITATAVLAVLGLAILAGAPKAQNFGASTAMAAPAPAAVPMPHACPNIHAAIDALRSAEHDMKSADHDFCGHRAEAMRTVHEAIEQLRAAEGCQRCQ
jgi:hypothetical protein